MTNKKPPVKKPTVNVSIHRELLDDTGDFLSALIVELIHYRFVKNDRKPVWLKIDWIHEKLPYISRAGLAKKLNKLVGADHIIMKKGEGRHYHKCWFSPSAEMREVCTGNGNDPSKVYYNLEMAAENLEGSVVYAAIENILKAGKDALWTKKHGLRTSVELQLDTGTPELILDNKKLAEGSGLSLNKVRKAVKWLIKHKKIHAKKVFGNKRLVSLRANTLVTTADLETCFGDELPTESFPHAEPEHDEPSEIYQHKDDVARMLQEAAVYFKRTNRKS